MAEFWFDGFPVLVATPEGSLATWFDGFPLLESEASGPATLDLYESITLTEFVKAVLNPLAVHAVENITVSEAVFKALAIQKLVVENILIQEDVRARLSGGRSAFESITITDVVTADLSQHIGGSANESISISEFVKAVLNPMIIRIAEMITITESVQFGNAGVVAYERIFVTDYVQIGTNVLTVHVAETISVTEGGLNADGAGGLGPAPPPISSVTADYWTVGI